MTGGSVAEILANGKTATPVYENGHAPITVKVIDPLNVPVESFRLYITDSTDIKPPPSSNPYNENVVTPNARWFMVKLPGGSKNDTIYSDASIAYPYEQIINGQPSGIPGYSFPKMGISVTVSFTHGPGDTLAFDNGALGAASSITYADPLKRWITGLPDTDFAEDQNWIRSGTAQFVAPEDPSYNDYSSQDDGQAFEKIVGGTWAPYRLCAFTPATVAPTSTRGGPAWRSFISQNSITRTASVDVIITGDKSKWTRCPVIEMQDEAGLSVGHAPKMSMRRSPSVDKNGKKAGDAGYNAAEGGTSGDSAGIPISTPTGMGWFPGYAINLETGERLNMAFGEDSYLPLENGADMIWNPTSTVYSGDLDPFFGGKHYIYVFGHNGNLIYPTTDAEIPKQFKDIPAYDKGKAMYRLFSAVETANSTAFSDSYKSQIYRAAMWVNIPILVPGHSMFETDVTVRLRVAKPFDKYSNGNKVDTASLVRGNYYFVETGPIKQNGKTYNTGSGFTAVDSFYTYRITSPSNITWNYSVRETSNSANGIYEFNTADIETHTNDAASAKEALDLINIVPNPYYAYSGYEKMCFI